jgi:hypothetical protein
MQTILETPYALSDEEKSLWLAKVSKELSLVITDYVINKDLVLGYRLITEGRVYDQSFSSTVKNKLKIVENNL